MILLLYFLAILALGRSLDPLPSKLEIESSINRTIDEVERLMRSDPSLPRLSRTQIVDILQNITSKDMKNFEDSVEEMRSNYQRALMVVLPYNAKDSSGDDLKELYTKPPLVQLIPDVGGMLPFASIQEEPKIGSKAAKSSGKLDGKPNYPEKFSFDLNDLRQKGNKNRKSTNLSPAKSANSPDLPPRTSTAQPPASSTVPATRSTNILTSDQWRYNAPPSTTSTPRRTTRPSVRSTMAAPQKSLKPVSNSKAFLPTVISVTSDTQSTKPRVPNRPQDSKTKPSTEAQTFKPKPLTMPQHLKPKSSTEPSQSPELTTFNLSEMINDDPVPLYVTPMSSQALTSQTSTPMREEVSNLLAAIGLQQTKPKQPQPESNDVDFQIQDSNMIPQFGQIASPSIPPINQQTTFVSPTNLRQGLSNLSPDLQPLFQRFGLPLSNQEVSTARPKASGTAGPRPTVDSWRGFKPLPMSDVKDEGMRSFLATFGLGDGRSKKAMKPVRTTEAPSVIDAVPDKMKGILENIGLITRSKPSEVHVFKPHEAMVSDDKQKDQINELLDTVKLVQEGKANATDVKDAANRLLMSTKTLQGGPDPASLEEILQRYNEDLRKEVKRQEQSKEEEKVKAEVEKEDEDMGEMASSDFDDSEMAGSDISETTTSPSTTLSASTTSAATTTKSDNSGEATDTDGRIVNNSDMAASASASEGPSLDDLADSFGGTTAAPDPVLPTPRRSGLYFLVDWNSFLEVGEEDKDKVNLRFAPKAGDRTRFIPVVIP